MSTIVLRSVKGSPLTNQEVDDNFNNLNTDKIQIGGTYSSGTAKGVLYLNGSKVLTTGSALTFDGTNLGIGTSSPGSELEVLSTDSATAIRVTSGAASTTTGTSTLRLQSFNSGSGVVGSAEISNTAPAGGQSILTFSTSASGNSPTERLRIDSSGNVGIGTSSPAEKLNIVGGDVLIGTDSGSAFNGDAFLRIQGGSNAYIGIKAGTAASAGILFGDTDDSFVGGMQYSNADNALFFNAGNTERLRIDSSGNLGIGTSSPAYRLDVISASGVASQITSGTGGVAALFKNLSSGTAAIEFAGTTTTNNVRLGAFGDVFTLNTGGSERLRIDSSGNVGIGTSSPTFTSGSGLEIERTDANATVRLQRAGTSPSSMEIRSGANTGEIFVTSNSPLLFATNGTERMRLDSSGNLGIGTSSPDSYNVLGGTLAAVAGTGISNVSIVSGASSTGNILFADGTSGDERRAGRIAYDHSVNNLYFFTNGNSLKATIDSSGNLGLGVTPSAWSATRRALQLSTSVAIWSTTSAASNASFGANVFDNGSESYINTGAASKYNQTNGVHAWFTAPSGTAGDAISFTQAMTLDASGRLLIGTTSSRTNNLSSASFLQLEAVNSSATGALVRNSADTGGAGLILGKSRGTSVGSVTAVASGDRLGTLSFSGTDGTSMLSAATIISEVDGTPGTNDMPGRLVFSTTADGASSPTERARIDSSGNLQMQTGAVMPYAPAPASISTTATLTNANIQGQIINTTGTSYTVTMPLGTTLETLASWATTSVAYDFYVINTASGTITMAVNTGVTSLGGLTIATGVSAQFRIRRTAANTFVLYRLG